MKLAVHLSSKRAAVHDGFNYFKGGSQLKLTYVEAEGQGKIDHQKYGLYFKGKEGSYIRPYVVYT